MNNAIFYKLKLLIPLLVIILALSINTSIQAGQQPQKNISIEVATTIPVETALKPEGSKNIVDTWLDMINNAQKKLDFGHFYMVTKKNERTEPIIEAIIKAAKRGVKVRLLIDKGKKGDMQENTGEVLERFKNQPNISSTTFNWKEFNGGIIHAKFMIADDKEIYVGSQNFDWRALKHIHETGLRIKCPVLADALTRIFDADWQFNNGDKLAYEKLKKQKPVVLPENNFLVSSPAKYNPPGVKAALDVLLSLIDNAKKKITIQLLSYNDYIRNSKEKFTAISEALTRAAGRGVAIKMMVADWGKKRPALLQKLVQIPNWDIKFVTIPQFSGGFIPFARVIHSKVMLVDDKISWVGTSNWGYGYFYGSRNIEIITHDPKVEKKLQRLFNALWTSKYAEMIDPKKEYTARVVNKKK
ncbi:MAG: phospholipase [bacterium]|nr:phospholipase [bacterium]